MATSLEQLVQEAVEEKNKATLDDAKRKVRALVDEIFALEAQIVDLASKLTEKKDALKKVSLPTAKSLEL